MIAGKCSFRDCTHLHNNKIASTSYVGSSYSLLTDLHSDFLSGIKKSNSSIFSG